MKRGAIGLAINMIVIIILSIVILGLGIAFLQSIMGGANDLKADLDAQTSNELERLMMDQNKKVAVPLNTATLFGGDNHVFGVGILNILDDRGFFISVEQTKFIDDTETVDDTDRRGNSWLLYNTENIQIAQNDHHKEAVLVSVPKDAARGTYIFNVRVTDDKGELYDNIKKFYVEVN